MAVCVGWGLCGVRFTVISMVIGHRMRAYEAYPRHPRVWLCVSYCVWMSSSGSVTPPDDRTRVRMVPHDDRTP